MAKAMNPRVWLIDDRMSEIAAKEKLGGKKIELTVTTPDDELFPDCLRDEWELILVDNQLWPSEPDRIPPQAVDGNSLVACIRAWGQKNGILLPPIVILTSQPEAYSETMQDVGPWLPIHQSFLQHEASVGRAVDVEWLFDKEDTGLAKKIADLAGSFAQARKVFGSNGINRAELIAFLQVSRDTPWFKQVERELRRACLPISEDPADGTFRQRGPATAIEWLLQRTLSFPGLFVSDNYAAITLGIAVDSFERALESDKKKRRGLRKCVYSGPCHTLQSRRWWAPGLNHLTMAAETKSEPMFKYLGLSLSDQLDIDNPVVALDEDMNEFGVVKVENCVRINPRGWPAEAIQPWMRINDAISRSWFQGMVDPTDLKRLGN